MANENQESVFSDPEMTQQSRADTTQSGVKKSSKSRLIMVVMGFFVLLLLVFGVVSLMSKSKPSTDGGAVPAPPNVKSIPGAPDQSQEYKDLIEQENLRKAQESGTSIPVLTSEGDGNANDPFGDSGPVVPVVPPIETPQDVTPVQTPPPVEQPVYEQPQQPVSMVPAAPTHSPEQYASMQTALQSYLQAWQVSPSPSQEFNYNGQEPKPVDALAVGANGGAMAGSVSGSSSGEKGPSFVRTGTVIPAMMMGSLNSDAPGPVVAQITTGPLAGSRLIGNFQSTGKKLLINFTTLSRPGLGTYSINAVAVDDNFSTGMATDVNNHTFKRFVLPTLAAFIQGYGQAFSRSGSTVVIGPGGSTVTQDPLTEEQARKAALGEAGAVITDSLLTNADVEPTVKLDCGGGCPVSLLFLSDL